METEHFSPTPLADHAPATQRMIFACAAAAPASRLTDTQRAAIFVSLQDRRWHPTPAQCPQTYAVVAEWYARLYGERRVVVETMTQAEGA